MDGFSGVKETDGAKNTTGQHVHIVRARHEAEVSHTRYPFVFHPSSFPYIATVYSAEELCVVDSALPTVLCVQTTKAYLSLPTVPPRATFQQQAVTILFAMMLSKTMCLECFIETICDG